jgi:hypothetical protein
MQLHLIRGSGVNSAKIVLVSHHLCPYVQRAAIALAEKAVLFERAYIDLADKPAWFTTCRRSASCRFCVSARKLSLSLRSSSNISKKRNRVRDIRTIPCGERNIGGGLNFHLLC